VYALADGFQGKACYYPIQLLPSYLLLSNNLKMLTETLLKIPFSVIRRCSQVPTTHWLQGKCTRTNLSQAAYGMMLRNHRQLPECIFNVKIAALESLKKVTGRIFKISYYFKRSKLKLEFDFCITTTGNERKNCKIRQRMYRKYLPFFLIISLKKIFIS
jgi:hypothetical protein